jgi:hypothetical protein
MQTKLVQNLVYCSSCLLGCSNIAEQPHVQGTLDSGEIEMNKIKNCYLSKTWKGIQINHDGTKQDLTSVEQLG